MNKTTIQSSPNMAMSRGKSFRFLGEWIEGQEYRNDCYVQDFVEFDGILWGCLETNRNRIPKKCDRYWKKAVVGAKGAKGRDIIGMYEFDSRSDDRYSYITIMVIYSDGTNEPFEFKVEKMKGDKGDPGKDGAAPTIKTIDGVHYWSINGEIIYDEDHQPIKADGVPGKDGSVVTIGEDGYWYIDGVKTEVAATFQGSIDSQITRASTNPVTSQAIYIANENLRTNLEDLREEVRQIATSQVTSVNGQVGDVNITAESIGALTEHQSLDNYYTKGEVDEKIGILEDALTWKLDDGN